MDNVKISHDQVLEGSHGLGSAFSCLNSARLLSHFCFILALADSTTDTVYPGVSWGL